MARANHANPTRGGASPWETQNPKKSNVRQTHCEASSPLPVHQNDHTSSFDECQEHTATLERFCEISFWGPLGLPRVMPTAGGVGVVGAGHGLWGASNYYSTPIFAPELAKHDPFRHPRAMVVVWVALHVPVQVLPHDLPTEAHGDPPSRSSVTCQ